MKKRLLTTLFGVLAVFSSAIADDVNYSGTVVSKSGDPIMGATVTVTGTTVSTITDMDGNFSIVVPDGYTTVTVTYSGMKKQTVAIQREPVVLYESAEQAEQARQLALKNAKNTLKKPYKKNAFNFELGTGAAMGNWYDGLDYLNGGFNYASVNLGWYHGFSKYITWEVINVGSFFTTDNFDMNLVNAYATTGIKLTTPRWKKVSLSYSFNLGVDYDGWSELANFMMSHKISVNFGKWFYLGFKYNVVNLCDEAKEYAYDFGGNYNNGSYSYNEFNDYGYGGYKYDGDPVEKLETGSFILGFNF